MRCPEHVILKQVPQFVEERRILLINQIGSRSSLSTQDVMLMRNYKLMGKITGDTMTVLALNLEKASTASRNLISSTGFAKQD